MSLIVKEDLVIDTQGEIVGLLIEFFATDMTKEELRAKYRELLKDWPKEE